MEGNETASHRFVLAKHFPEFRERARKHLLNSPLYDDVVRYVQFSGDNPCDVVRDILKTSSTQKLVMHKILYLLGKIDFDLSDLTAADFNEFAKNEYFSQQDQADLLISKGLNPSVLLEIIMNHCAGKGYSLPEWVFAFMERDDLDVASLKAPLRNVFKIAYLNYLSNQLVNKLISRGFVTAQNVFDWSLEKNELSLYALLDSLKSISSPSSLTLNAENTLLLSEHLTRTTYLTNDHVDFLVSMGVSPLIVAKSLIQALSLEGSCVQSTLMYLAQKHPEVLIELEVQEVVALLKVVYFSDEELSRILSVAKDREALAKAIEATEVKNDQEIYHLFRFAQAASLDPRKIPGFDIARFFEGDKYLNDTDFEYLAKNGFEVLVVFKAALTPRMLKNNSWSLSQFVRNHLDDLKSELTEDGKKPLKTIIQTAL